MAAKATKDKPLEQRSKDELAKLADKKDVDVEGTGSGGNVLKQDLVDALDGQREAPNDVRSNPSLEQPKAEKALAEVREIHARIRERNQYANRTELTHEVTGVAHGDDEPDVLRLQTVGGRLFVSCTAREVELDHDGVADLQRKVQQAFQAVS